MFLDLNCFLVNELKGTALRSKNSKEKCLFKIPISIKGLNLITGHLLKSQGCDSVNLDPAILDKIIRMSSVLTLRVRNNLGWLTVSHWIDTLNLIISNQICRVTQTMSFIVRKSISTSERHAEHSFAGQNIQHRCVCSQLNLRTILLFLRCELQEKLVT